MADAGAAHLYWDASAILSAIGRDIFSDRARAWQRAQKKGSCSSLAFSEVHAVLRRDERAGLLSSDAVSVALCKLARSLQPLDGGPEAARAAALAARHPLRGADLWHLAYALDLRALDASFRLLTFDDRLRAAAEAEGIAAGEPPRAKRKRR